MLDVEFFRNYTDKDISVIPVRMMWDDRKEIFSGKFPAVKGWQKYCTEIADDEEIDSWKEIKSCSGVAYVTGAASNLACVDIDTEDPDLARQIAEVLPYTPCRILGHPKRYGKLLYKISEFPNSVEWGTMVQKRQIKNSRKEVVCDIFMGNAYIVAPPSIHSQNKNGSNATYYRWFDESMSLENVGIDNLPVLPEDAFYKISQLMGGETAHSINLSGVSPESEFRSTGRHSAMMKKLSGIIRRRVRPDKAIAEIMEYDKQVHKDNPYLVDRTKGCSNKYAVINAAKVYADLLASCNKTGEEELPRLEEYAPIYLKDWSEMRPIQERKQNLDIFDLNLIPRKWRSLVGDVATSNGVPEEICFYLLLTSLSSLIGNKRVIVPKKKNKSWEEAFNIWTIYVSPSGTRKTQVLKTLTKFINDIQRDIDEEYADYTARQLKTKDVVDEQVKQLEKQIKKEVELTVLENGGAMTPSSEREIDRLQSMVEDLRGDSEIIPKKQLVVKGVTVEKLIEVLSANKNGTFLEYNELTQLTQLFKKKGYESLRTLLLDSWDGLRPYSYQTKGAGEVFIEKNCSSLYASVQNSIFEKELREIAHDVNDDGFYQRSFIVVNDSPVAMAIDQEFNISEYKEAFDPFRDAYAMGESEDKVVCSDDAYWEYMKFEQEMLQMATSEQISALSSFWGKFTGKVVKVASLLEFIDSGPHFREIGYDSMCRAVALMKRQIIHIQNMFPDPNFEHAREIIRLVGLGCIKDGVDHEKLVRSYPPLRDTKTCQIVSEILYQHNVIDVIARNGKFYYYFNDSIKPVDTEL